MKPLTSILAVCALISFSSASPVHAFQNRQPVEARAVKNNIAFGTPVQENVAFGHAVQAEEGKPRQIIGVQLYPIQGAVAAQLPEYVQPAIMLSVVFEGSPAERAGLMVFDVLSAIDGDPNATIETLREKIAAKSIGQYLQLEVYRNGTPRVVNVAIETFTPPTHQLKEHVPTGVGNVEFSNTREGNQAFPRFGIAPDGNIMIQKLDGDTWINTDSSVGDHGTVTDWISSGTGNVDLNHPHVDPNGELRHTIDNLRSFYGANNLRLKAKGQVSKLEHRIVQLESKLDELNTMMTQLLELAKR